MPFKWRLRKSVKLAPGIKLNLSKSGISTTLGKKGASVNVGKKGMRTTVGIPGTGISHTSKIGDGLDTRPARNKSSCCSLFVLPIILLPALWLIIH